MVVNFHVSDGYLLWMCSHLLVETILIRNIYDIAKWDNIIFSPSNVRCNPEFKTKTKIILNSQNSWGIFPLWLLFSHLLTFGQRSIIQIFKRFGLLGLPYFLSPWTCIWVRETIIPGLLSFIYIVQGMADEWGWMGINLYPFILKRMNGDE